MAERARVTDAQGFRRRTIPAMTAQRGQWIATPTDEVLRRVLFRAAAFTVGATCMGIVVLDRVFHPSHSWWVTLPPIALVVGAWAAEARAVRWPRVLLALTVSVPVGWLRYALDAEIAPILLMPMACWTGATGRRWEGAVGAGLAISTLLPFFLQPGTFWPWSTGVVFSWLAGAGLAIQQRLLAELGAAQADLQRRATLEERQRIAREIHDVAAHSLAVTMLHLTGARLLLQRVGGDPRAVEALAEAERLGRQSLDDVRRTVGLLEGAEGPTSGLAAPLPAGADLCGLVQQYRDAGLDVSLEVDGDLARVSGATGLALYRITQEALANTVKHAPGASASVHVTVNGEVHLEVHNTRGTPTRLAGQPDAPHGRGLAGMRERAALLGGSIMLGPDRDGWRVTCALPRQHEATGTG